MAPVLKTGIPERVSGVRIPPSPPYSLKCREICLDCPGKNYKSPQFCGFSLTNRTGESVLLHDLTFGQATSVEPSQKPFLDRRHVCGAGWRPLENSKEGCHHTSTAPVFENLPGTTHVDPVKIGLPDLNT